MEIERYVRRPFNVDAVRVTEDNINEVAEWCGGKLRVNEKGAKPETHIKVDVKYAKTVRQTMAFVGDWVLYAGTGFKVYTPTAFEKSFEKVSDGEPYHILALNTKIETDKNGKPVGWVVESQGHGGGGGGNAVVNPPNN